MFKLMIRIMVSLAVMSGAACAESDETPACDAAVRQLRDAAKFHFMSIFEDTSAKDSAFAGWDGAKIAARTACGIRSERIPGATMTGYSNALADYAKRHGGRAPK